MLRGGAFVLGKEDLRSALRYRLLPEDAGPYIGFRGALSGTAGGPDLSAAEPVLEAPSQEAGSRKKGGRP